MFLFWVYKNEVSAEDEKKVMRKIQWNDDDDDDDECFYVLNIIDYF